MVSYCARSLRHAEQRDISNGCEAHSRMREGMQLQPSADVTSVTADARPAKPVAVDINAELERLNQHPLPRHRRIAGLGQLRHVPGKEQHARRQMRPFVLQPGQQLPHRKDRTGVGNQVVGRVEAQQLLRQQADRGFEHVFCISA